MCTLSWLLHDNGYDVFFNRDEQRTRQKAILPALNSEQNAIMPIDPQGQGTWIASNRRGMTLCLLNNYQKQASISQSAKYVSRGQLIPDLINLNNNIEQNLKALNLSHYQAFFLCAFPAGLTNKQNSIAIYQWDGNMLTQEKAQQPFISSGVLLPQVQQTRSAAFTQIVGQKNTPAEHLAYHASHLPEKGYSSVCMHREDASTQSLCHISVKQDITFRYHDGPPCKNKAWIEIKTPVL